MSTALILACSPRKGGNSDTAAHCLAAGADGRAELLHLRDYHVLPCRGCMACMAHPESACVLAKKDDAQALIDRIRAASALFVAAPIYFYHLPAGLKALIDRGQAAWAARVKATAQGLPDPAPRPAVAALVAGCERGEKLFAGSLLTLRYFLEPLDHALAHDCCLRGYDAAGTLAADAAACARLRALGAEYAPTAHV